MEIKIILIVIIGVLTQIGCEKVIDDLGCTYTGAKCPETPCCNSKFECQLTTHSLFSLPPELYELSARNRTYKCLEKIPLEGSCLFHEECTHIENARCIGSVCKCPPPYINSEGQCYSLDQYKRGGVVINRI